MPLNINKQLLPPVYIHDSKEYYLDPIRKRLIHVTPEETVRQCIISYLIHDLNVPQNMITVEEHLSHYGIDSKLRADIVVHKYNEKSNENNPIAIIECKAPHILLGEKSINQVINYTNILECDYAMLTDGESAFFYRYDLENDRYVSIENLPTYSEMLHGSYTLYDPGEIPPRIPLKKIKDKVYLYQEYDIGKHTNLNFAVPLVNLLECLLDESHKMPKGEYHLFELTEDFGVRMLSYGDASGGIFSGPYRSFLISVNGNTEFVSIGISQYSTWAHMDTIKTAINVGVDNGINTHHSLQLVADDNMTIINNKCRFYHHGRIAVGNIGSGKVNELRQFVADRYDKILVSDRFYLGELTNDRLWYLDDAEIIKFIENLISYSLIRDEYRLFVKNNKQNKLK